jgi:hypothetical protein
MLDDNKHMMRVIFQKIVKNEFGMAKESRKIGCC